MLGRYLPCPCDACFNYGIRQLVDKNTPQRFRLRLVRIALGSAAIQAISRLLTLGLGILLARGLGA